MILSFSVYRILVWNAWVSQSISQSVSQSVKKLHQSIMIEMINWCPAAGKLWHRICIYWNAIIAFLYIGVKHQNIDIFQLFYFIYWLFLFRFKILLLFNRWWGFLYCILLCVQEVLSNLHCILSVEKWTFWQIVWYLDEPFE